MPYIELFLAFSFGFVLGVAAMAVTIAGRGDD